MTSPLPIEGLVSKLPLNSLNIFPFFIKKPDFHNVLVWLNPLWLRPPSSPKNQRGLVSNLLSVSFYQMLCCFFFFFRFFSFWFFPLFPVFFFCPSKNRRLPDCRTGLSWTGQHSAHGFLSPAANCVLSFLSGVVFSWIVAAVYGHGSLKERVRASLGISRNDSTKPKRALWVGVPPNPGHNSTKKTERREKN